MILVPVKNLANAKQRLSPVMEQAGRTQLAQAMLADVLDSLVAAAIDDVSLVTCDAFAIDLAGELGFDIIRDDLNVSETSAIEMASQLCSERGIKSTLVIPADIPLISHAEIGDIYRNAPEHGTLLVPSGDKRGTNAVLRRPAQLFPLRFGNDSFFPHLAAAIATNKTCVVLSLPGIALDVDTPDDLQQLSRAPGGKRSQLLARTLGFYEAPLTVNSY